MDEYDWVSLDEDEELLWSGEPRMVSIIPAIAVGIVMLPFFGIGLLVMAGAYLQVKNTDFVVTSQGLYRKQGVLSRNVQKIGFDKVQNISFSQGVLGNYFGYGNVDISTAGGSGIEMSFNSIQDPKSVQELINKRIKDQGTGRSETGERDVMTQILEETRKTREVLERIEDKI